MMITGVDRTNCNKDNIRLEEGEVNVIKKTKRYNVERILQIASKLRKRIEEHENNKVETQNKLKEVCNIIREEVDRMEDRFNNTLEQYYTEGETRLQEAIEKVKILEEESDEMSEEEIDKKLREAEAALCCVQKYELIHQFKNAKNWINDILNTELKLDIKQSLSDEISEGRVPRITEVNEAGPNEVEVGIKFLEEEEKEMLKDTKMKECREIEYTVEMWNGEEDEEYEVKTTQIIGSPHKAFVEWRFVGGSECKVRVQALWKGLHGEEQRSSWSEWAPFTVPSAHKNYGIHKTGLAWERWKARETYTVTDKATNEVLYNGTKPYTMLSQSTRGHDLLISGRKENSKWEETRKIEVIPENPESLLDDLRIFHTDSDVCIKSLKAIRLKARSSYKNRTNIENLGGLGVLLNIARNNIDDANVRDEIFLYCDDFIKNNPIIRLISDKLERIELVRDAIKQHIDNANVCLKGICAVANIVGNNPGIRTTAVELGFIELIEDVIKQHINDVRICNNGLCVISNIVYGNQSNKKQVVNPEFIELTKDVVKQHIDNAGVCNNGLNAINTIVHGNPLNQKFACELGCIELIRDAIKQHIDNADVCGRGLNAIKNITYGNPDIQKFVGESGCIELIRDVIKQHIDNADVRYMGLCAIVLIIYDNMDNQRLSGELGWIELTRDVIKQYIDNAAVCGRGLCVLLLLTSGNLDNQKLAVELGFIELIRDVIKRHIGDVGVCDSGLCTISNIVARNPSNQKLAIKSGFIELIRDVVKQHTNNVYMCSRGLDVTNNIVHDNPSNQNLACELGCIDLIFEIIKHHKDGRGFVEFCCKYLVRLLSTQEIHSKWCTEDVLEKVEELSARFSDSQFIKKCLACLEREEDPRVTDAVLQGVCTKEATKCGKEDCPREKRNCLCEECAAPQKCFQCLDCQGCRVCCETCMKTKHDGHNGVVFYDIITYC